MEERKKLRTNNQKKKLFIYKKAEIVVNMGGSVVSPCTLPCCGSLCRS